MLSLKVSKSMKSLEGKKRYQEKVYSLEQEHLKKEKEIKRLEQLERDKLD